MIYDMFDSPLGKIVVSSDGEKITRFQFEGQQHYRPIPATWSRQPHHALMIEVKKQTHEYFTGKRKHFDLPLAPTGTAFQKKVWKMLEQIPYGEVITYGKIAVQMGNPKAVRAVGAANGKNPICIIVPCHRVIGANGTLTGYAGGLDRKEKLLELEGITI